MWNTSEATARQSPTLQTVSEIRVSTMRLPSTWLRQTTLLLTHPYLASNQYIFGNKEEGDQQGEAILPVTFF